MGDSDQKVKRIKVKRSLAEKSNGFAIDIGGSVVKIVYLAKDEWEKKKPSEDPNEEVFVYFKTYSRDDVEQAMRFIKDQVYIRRQSPDATPIIYTSDVGTNMMAERFKKEYSVQVQNTLEFDDVIMALEFCMENNDHEDIFIPIPEEGYAEGVRKCIMSLGSIEAFINLGDASKIIIDVNKYEKCKAYFTDARETLKNGDPLPRALPKTYPYLLGQFGSGFCYLVVNEDGSYTMADLMSFAGRTFLDLGRIMTGVKAILDIFATENDKPYFLFYEKSYAELIALAEAGHEDNLNVRYCDSVDSNVQDIYQEGSSDEVIIYSFGKLHGKDLNEVDKSDMARTLLQNICLMAISTAFNVMLANGCRNLYLTGSFVTSKVTQDLLTNEFEFARGRYINMGTEELSTSDLRMEISNCSSWLGCLGAFLTGCKQ